MLCLVADNTREDQAEQIGRIIGARLRAAAKARGWTQGQVHYQANRGQSDEIVSLATVSALLRGSIASPSVANTLAVARALELTLDQVVGISPMPETAPLPVEDDLSAQFSALKAEVRELRRGLAQFLETEASADRQEAEEIEQTRQAEQRARAAASPLGRRRKAK